ncbi:hypothetical protein PHLGIDRAFT_115192 [Phlebiopsis gigantea 11061_1 CR5-6]|uniref:BOD1/SHG1 domain-containing protein n=1 Tax=Phlebiopsis gigantea (strain 11061_1 CR5-6) TaxID=745531 RepID=A0A0C3NYX0_PHLG1|nr:hypothetical protein PHLGIDRAFT_115192 [Phlebiopsis gigantea 11061_1 CR5-6]
MPIENPAQLAEEFKQSAEFDRLRRELLEEFRNGDGLAPFVARVEDIVRKKLHYDSKLLFGPEATAQRELAQEYPVVERAVSDIPSLADADFSSRLRESLSRVLQKSRSGDMAATSEFADVEMGDRSTLPQLRIPVLNGHAKSKDQDNSRSRHLHAQQEPDSDSDSAMEESPVSDHGEVMVETNYQVNGIDATVPQITEHLAPDSLVETISVASHSGVDTPMGNSSAIDSPMSDSLADKSAAVDYPVVNSPAINSPVINSPVINSPAVNPPAIDSPAVLNSPIANSPVVTCPTITPPELDLPVVDAPELSQASDMPGDIPI